MGAEDIARAMMTTMIVIETRTKRTSMISLIRGMRRKARTTKRIMMKTKDVTSGLIHAMRKRRTIMANGAGTSRNGAVVIARMKGIIAGDRAAITSASVRLVARDGLLPVAAGGLLPVTGGDLRQWIATACGRSAVRVAGLITRRGARMDMMKAGGAGPHRSVDVPLPSVDVPLPSVDIPRAAALPAGASPVHLREAVARAVSDAMPASSSPAAAESPVMVAVVLPAAAARVGVEPGRGR